MLICKNHVRHLFFLFLVLSLTSKHAISSPDDWSRMSDEMIISDFQKVKNVSAYVMDPFRFLWAKTNGTVTPRMLISDKLPATVSSKLM